MSQGTFSDNTDSIGSVNLKEYYFFVQKWTFFQGVSPGFWVKMTKFSSRHFSLVYVPRDLGVL